MGLVRVEPASECEVMGLMVSKPSLLYLGASESNDITQRPQHFAQLLAKHYPLVYIQPIGLRNLRLTDYRRVLMRLGSLLHRGNKPRTLQFETANIFYVPFPSSPKIVSFNERLLWAQVKTRFGLNTLKGYILWIGSPNMLARVLLKRARPCLSIYDCMDDLGAMHCGKEAGRIVREEKEVIRSVDIVLASSKNLYEMAFEQNANTFLVPNGVDLAKFNTAFKVHESIPGEIPEGRPIIGYYGTLDRWVNFDLLDYVAKSRPDWNIILIGPWKLSSQRLLQRPNVRWLGPKSYETLPSYARTFTVATIPFHVDQLTQAVNPVKLYEYLAMGKPVVSTPLIEVEKFSPLVRIARSNEEFLACLQEEIERCPDRELVRQRRAAVQSYSWESRVAQVEEIICAFMKRAEQPADFDQQPT